MPVSSAQIEGRPGAADATSPGRRPRYQALADSLVESIASGDLPIGARIPSEHDLCATHSMSRGTVRQALRCLEDLGMIARSPMGTTVSAVHPVDAYHPSAETPGEIMDLLHSTRLLRPKSDEVLADVDLAEWLGVGVGSHWFSLIGPLVMKSDPSVTLCWSEHYHSTDKGRTMLLKGEFTAGGIGSSQLEQVISAEPMSEAPSRALDAPLGSAALIVRRTHRDSSGQIVKVSVHTHRGDRYRVRSITHDGAMEAPG
jgi:GntR family transcriptional regulator